jgi:hypothetical protein
MNLKNALVKSVHDVTVCTIYRIILYQPLCSPQIFFCKKKRNVNIKSYPITVPKGSRSLRLPEFLDTRHMKVAELLALRIGRLYPSGKNPWYSVMLKTEPTSLPWCRRKDYINGNPRPSCLYSGA